MQPPHPRTGRRFALHRDDAHHEQGLYYSCLRFRDVSSSMAQGPAVALALAMTAVLICIYLHHLCLLAGQCPVPEGISGVVCPSCYTWF